MKRNDRIFVFGLVLFITSGASIQYYDYEGHGIYNTMISILVNLIMYCIGIFLIFKSIKNSKKQ